MKYISLCCDENYLWYAKNLIKSIWLNNPWLSKNLCVFVFFWWDRSILLNSWIQELLDSFWYSFDYHIFWESIWSNLKSCTYLGKSTYYRLYTPKILLSKWIEKSLYLDIDIICDNYIDNIFNININNKLFAVAMENSYNTFNCGVMYINNKERERESVTKKIISYIKNNPDKIIAWDQSAMNNIVNKDRYSLLKPRYNLSIQYRFYRKENTYYTKKQIKREIKNWVFFHFNAKKKPWHYFCLHPKAILRYKNNENKRVEDMIILFINYVFSNIANMVFKTNIINIMYNIKFFKKIFLLIMTGHK